MNTRNIALLSSMAALTLCTAVLADDPGVTAQASAEYSLQAQAGVNGPAEVQAGASPSGRLAVDETLDVPVDAALAGAGDAATEASGAEADLHGVAHEIPATGVQGEVAGALNSEAAGGVRNVMRPTVQSELRSATRAATGLLR